MALWYLSFCIQCLCNTLYDAHVISFVPDGHVLPNNIWSSAAFHVWAHQPGRTGHVPFLGLCNLLHVFRKLRPVSHSDCKVSVPLSLYFVWTKVMTYWLNERERLMICSGRKASLYINDGNLFFWFSEPLAWTTLDQTTVYCLRPSRLHPLRLHF